MTPIEMSIFKILAVLSKTKLELKNRISTKLIPDLNQEFEKEKEKVVLSKYRKTLEIDNEKKIKLINKESLDIAQKTLRVILRQNNPTISLSFGEKKNKKAKRK